MNLSNEEFQYRIKRLDRLSNMPIEFKVADAENKILDSVNKYGIDSCCVAFSGGKDS